MQSSGSGKTAAVQAPSFPDNLPCFICGYNLLLKLSTNMDQCGFGCSSWPYSAFLPVPGGAVWALANTGTLKVRETLNTDLLLNRSEKNLKKSSISIALCCPEGDLFSNFPAPAPSEALVCLQTPMLCPCSCCDPPHFLCPTTESVALG